MLIAGPCVIESEAHAVELGARDPRHRPARRRAVRLQGVVRQGEPHVARLVPRPGLDEGLPVLGACARRRRRADPDRHPRAVRRPTRPPRSPTCCRFRRSCRGRPTCSSPRRAPGASSTSRRDSSSRRSTCGTRSTRCARPGNERVFVTERGFSFGYNNLVVDMRAFPMHARARLPGRLRRDAQPAAAGRRRRRHRRTGRVHRAAGLGRRRARASTACSSKCTRTRRSREERRAERAAARPARAAARSARPDQRHRHEALPASARSWHDHVRFDTRSESIELARRCSQTEARRHPRPGRRSSTRDFERALDAAVRVHGPRDRHRHGQVGHHRRKICRDALEHRHVGHLPPPGRSDARRPRARSSEDDVVIALSHSGETEELVRLLEAIRRIGARLIALTGDPDVDAGPGGRRHARLPRRRRSLSDEPRADGQHDGGARAGRRAGDGAARAARASARSTSPSCIRAASSAGG